MKIPAKRLLSLLMVFVMVLGIFPAVMAAETDGSVDSITDELEVFTSAVTAAYYESFPDDAQILKNMIRDGE